MELPKSAKFNEQHIELERPAEIWKRSMQFMHNELLYISENKRTIQRDALINRLNHIHFEDNHILILLKDNESGEIIIERLCPEKCVDNLFTCRWLEKDTSLIGFERAEILCLLIDDGLEVIIVPIKTRDIDKQFLTFNLPKKSYYGGLREARRYACSNIRADVNQNGLSFHGELLDFSRNGFRIKMKPDSLFFFNRLNLRKSITIYLRNHGEIFYSGECLLTRRQAGLTSIGVVLTPVNEDCPRFKKKNIRNPRQQLKPSPVMIFNHPILEKKVQIEAYDISTSGFSVNVNPDEEILIPGMIIKGLTICFAGSICIKCDVQVVYRSKTERRKSRIGITILDMDVNAYTKLASILTNSIDPHAFVASDVDMDALWEFFFEAGFIYPKKYDLIRSYRREFKEIYRKLYQENSEITKHFIYKKNGRIYGHISMLRAHERSWLVHHHIARSTSLRAGFQVLRLITHYLNDMCRFPSTKIDYIMSYFRPENRFPNRVYGGFARSLSNHQGCSLDLFGYLPQTTQSFKTRLFKGWRLEEISSLDHRKLNYFYEQHSGGLLLRAMNLDRVNPGKGDLERIYRQEGFFRKQKIYSLRFRDDLAAVMVLNQSDPGINLSELMNSMIIFIISPSDLPWNILSMGIARLSRTYRMEKIPILFYPFDYVEKAKIPCERRYQAWVINVEYGDDWLEYMQKTFKAMY